MRETPRASSALRPFFARRSAVVATLALGAVLFAAAVYHHVPVGTWLSLRYAWCWALSLLFSAASVGSGHLIVRALAPYEMGLQERLVLAFTTGVVAFTSLTFIGGIAGVLGGAFFFATPLLLIAATGPRAYRDLYPQIRTALARQRHAPRTRAGVVLVTGLGALGVLLVYLPILAPANASFDARWYHVAIAEHYAADHAIRRFPEGLLAGTYPQMATLLYTWAFTSPLGELFDHIELAAHLEFVVFLVTLAGIPVLVRRLVPDADASWSWAALFLFPGIFVYDAELCLGADHIAALFAVPSFLVLIRAWEKVETRTCMLLGVLLSGVLLTKYTAASVALGPALAIAARAVYMGLRPAPNATGVAGPWKALGALAAVCVTLTAQHWLRNWLFYGAPFYPMLAESFHPRPWATDAPEWYRAFRTTQMAGSIPDSVTVHSARDLLYVLATFSWDVHDFPHFHGKIPVFGSLFTVATMALPFLKRTGLVWGVTLATYAGLVFWALLHPEDRYLQTLLPWMVAVTVAVFLLTWRLGTAARATVCLLIGLQVWWGSDAYLLPSHAMTKQAPVSSMIDLVGRRSGSERADRLHPFGAWPKIGQVLPRDARVLVHETDLHLGLGAPAVLDAIPFMYGIDYGRARSMRDVHELLVSMGVTHLVWQPASVGSDSFAGDLAFHAFAARHTATLASITPYTVATMPSVPPADLPFGSVVLIVCAPNPYAPGLYEFGDLAVPALPRDTPGRHPAPRKAWDALGRGERFEHLAEAEFVVAEPGCAYEVEARALLAGDAPRRLTWLAKRGRYALYARKP